ncbi:MAG: hypothetical protein R3255_04955 [Candidatus Lokiarchaeia archaeon]|nr:hypothetical protein [Candidatus Lokiarchaeia archaeon]
MRCEVCLREENLYMCFFKEKNKEVYLCAGCLGKMLTEDPPPPIYNMSQLAYTWKKTD